MQLHEPEANLLIADILAISCEPNLRTCTSSFENYDKLALQLGKRLIIRTILRTKALDAALHWYIEQYYFKIWQNMNAYLKIIAIGLEIINK